VNYNNFRCTAINLQRRQQGKSFGAAEVMTIRTVQMSSLLEAGMTVAKLLGWAFACCSHCS